MIATLKDLRRSLHQYPEVSGSEALTARRIRTFIDPYAPDEVMEGVGGHGLLFIYKFGAAGPTILVRCELDALPIEEVNNFEHRSRVDGVSHKCGHDGHMTIVAGLAPWLHQQSFDRGKVILLFQPSEETGEGAKAMLDDPRFAAIRPDYVFALHNIPGVPLHQVILVPRQFSATVQSIAIRFYGQTSHAAEPEHGKNPAWAMAEITRLTATWTIPDPADPNFTLITPVYTLMGQKDYGISAGYGELHFTMRTWSVENMEHLIKRLEHHLDTICRQYHLRLDTEYLDYFPATVNSDGANELIRTAARDAGLAVFQKPVPFKFGEDFGWFAQRYTGAMFGLGAGMDTPVLHNEAYDFPDALIDSGMEMFQRIISLCLATDTIDDSGW
ncbi:MAG: amidohydrolase [Saprospiraceae bacterium]|nr:amidohydrolase [Lewinella sp.]